MSISSLQPSVIHLVTLFKQISNGEIRIPAFQRKFVWKERQIIELLESVSEGFPIGSLLMWNVEKKTLELAPSNSTSFPELAEKFPTNYLLDGMQRLSSLFGVFHFEPNFSNDYFDVSYDLKRRTFFHTKDADIFSDNAIPLSALFSPRRLLQHQGDLAQKPEGDELIDELLSLQAVFQEYLVPVVTIKNEEINRIVRIFEKINSTGTKLDPVDFMRAITWSEAFDLNKALEGIAEETESMGSSISDETLIKCVGLSLGVPPTTVGLLDLRDYRPAELHDAFTRTKKGLEAVLSFLASELSVFSTDCVPYEGQILMLFSAVGLDDPTRDEVEQLMKWYWAVGFNEALRGKPDHYVVRAVSDWRQTVRGGVKGLEPRLRLSGIDLVQRRIVKGKALSLTFMTMFAAAEARHLVNGRRIEPQGFLDSSDTSWFEPVFNINELSKSSMSSSLSARILGNVILVDKSMLDRRFREIPVKNWICDAARDGHWDWLHSQFIDEASVSALEASDVDQFFQIRGSLMERAAKRLIEG